MSRFAWKPPSKGDLVGRWRLERKLGEGGNAFVWLGVAEKDRVAVKILKRPEGSERYDRFAQEVQTHLDLLPGIPHVLPLLDADIPGGEVITDAPWLAMPEAIPLASHLGSTPSPEDVVDALIPIASVLALLFEQHGISHRDIKPENLYWFDGAPAIGDFGLVALPDGADISPPNRDLGPRSLLPPEMRGGQPERAGPPADVYELGLTIFLLITGEAIVGGLRADVDSHKLAVRLGRPALAELDHVLQCATRYEPGVRPTMAQLAGELRAWRQPAAEVAGLIGANSIRRQLMEYSFERRDERREVWNETLSVLSGRIQTSAMPLFRSLNDLGLQPAPTSHRFLERLSDDYVDLRGGFSVSLQPARADTAVWLGAGVMCGSNEVGSAHVGACWVVASHDAPPRILWRSLIAVDPSTIEGLREADAAVAAWAEAAQAPIGAFLAEVKRFAAIAEAPAEGADTRAPTLKALRLIARPMSPSRRLEIIAQARIADSGSGVAGAGYSSSPSQLRLRGPSGELRDFIFSADAGRVSGTRRDGFYEDVKYVEAEDADGEWYVEYVLLADQGGRSEQLDRNELQSRGCPTAVLVCR